MYRANIKTAKTTQKTKRKYFLLASKRKFVGELIQIKPKQSSYKGLCLTNPIKLFTSIFPSLNIYKSSLCQSHAQCVIKAIVCCFHTLKPHEEIVCIQQGVIFFTSIQ